MSPTVTEPASESRSISAFYKPWEKQVLFHTSPAKYRLEVGGFGSGKSFPLLMEAIFHCLEYPGSNALILRKTIPDLKRTVIDKFVADIPRWMYEFHNKSDHIVFFHPQPELDARGKPTGKMLQSKLYFGACEREADVGKYLSTEYVFIGFEELGEFSFAIWDALAGRNRCPIPGSRPCMAGATNPMGIGWSWIKKLWVDGKPLMGMDDSKYNPRDYAYFHSTVDDNPIYREDQEYIASLEKSPLRDKIRWGKLESVSGQYFDNWQASYKTSEGKLVHRHVRPASDFLFEDWQPVWTGWDYGFGHFACLISMTKALLKPRWEGEKPKMVNVVIKELWLHETTPEDQTKAYVMSIPRKQKKKHTAGEVWDDEPETVDDEFGYQWKVDSIHFSWERFNRTTSNRTVADEVGDILSLAGLPRPTRSNTDRIAGWQKIYSLLDSDDLFVLDTCPALAEAIPLLVRDKVKLEDVEKPKGLSLNDDLGDAFRYAVAGVLLDPEDKPEHIKKREKYAAIKDPMARAVSMYTDYNKEQARERRPQKPINVPSWYRRVRPEE